MKTTDIESLREDIKSYREKVEKIQFAQEVMESRFQEVDRIVRSNALILKGCVEKTNEDLQVEVGKFCRSSGRQWHEFILRLPDRPTVTDRPSVR